MCLKKTRFRGVSNSKNFTICLIIAYLQDFYTKRACCFSHQICLGSRSSSQPQNHQIFHFPQSLASSCRSTLYAYGITPSYSSLGYIQNAKYGIQKIGESKVLNSQLSYLFYKINSAFTLHKPSGSRCCGRAWREGGSRDSTLGSTALR